MEEMMTLLLLFYEFFKAGLFAIGGGLATLPFLYDIAARYDWLPMEAMPDMIAVSESTPGPLGINMATYAGYHAYGVLGAIVATTGLVLPSLIVIIIVANFLKKFQHRNTSYTRCRIIFLEAVFAKGWFLILINCIC